MLTDDQKRSVTQYLNEYCFQTIWNSVSSEFRGNFSLTSVSARLRVSSFVYGNSVVGLPTTSPFMVYRFSANLLQNSITFTDTNWRNLVTAATTYGTKLSVYDVDGNVVPMCDTWVMSPVGSNIVFVAVSKNAVIKALPNSFSTPLYMTVFKNNRSLTESWVIFSKQLVKKTDADNAIAAAQLQAAGTSFAVVNGISYPDLTDLPTLNVGDYVDVGTDPTVYAEFVVASDDTTNGYFSTLYNGDREILHCPKALNPNQWLFTHDGATVFVRDVNTRQSRYFHRVDPVSIKQITHNDLSASHATIQAFKAAMGSTEVEIVVKIRTHPVSRTLSTESSWISDLYLCNDDLIIGHLRGVLDDTLTFWKASVIEQSGYIQMMFDTKNTYTPDRLDMFVSALGYYTVGAILSSNVYHGTYNGVDVSFIKPYLQLGREVTPFLFINGRKVPQVNVDYQEYDVSRAVIGVTNESAYSSGSSLSVQTLDSGVPTPQVFTPTAENPSLTISSDTLPVYTRNSDTEVSGYGRTSNTAYAYTPPGFFTYMIYGNNDGTFSMVFSEKMYGTTVVIPPSRFMWSGTYELDALLADPQPLIFPITVETSDNTVMPLLNYGSANVFLNGYYLVQDVDYKLDPYYGPQTGGVMMLDLIITTNSYIDLTSTGNTLEVFISTDSNPSRDVGYVVDNIMARSNLVSFWYPQVSTAFAEGKIVSDLTDYAVFLVANDQLPNGNLFELKPSYPEAVSELLSDYSPTNDQTTISAINTYLGRITPALPELVTLTMEHKVFSPFLTAIGYDISHQKFIIADDASDTTFLQQFAPYQYLKDRDPTLKISDSRVDRHYLSVAASYAQFPPMTTNELRLYQRLITLVLFTSTATIGETLV